MRNIAIRDNKPVFDIFGSWKTDKLMKITSLAMTYDCPSKCNFCSCEQQKKLEEGLLTNKEYITVIKDSIKLGTSVFVFTGGEPMLRKDIYELIEEASKEAQTVLFTNGIYLTENNCKKLKEVGLDAIMVSISSTDAQTHDNTYKTKGLHRKALDGASRGLNEGLLVSMATCMTKENVGEVEGLISLAYNSGFHEINLREYVPTIYDKDNSLILMESDWESFDKLKNKYTRLPRPFSVIDQRHMECKGGGKLITSIDPYGNVLYCDFNPLSFGNVKDKPLPEIIAEIEDDGYGDRYAGKCKMKCKSYRKMIGKEGSWLDQPQ